MLEDNEEILKVIFQARAEELAKLDKEDIDFMDREANRDKKYYNLKNQLDRIPDNFYKLKEQISKSIEDHVETIDYENFYFMEKYYINGLKDGINLMNEVKG